MTAAIFDFADIRARLQNGFREPVKAEALVYDYVYDEMVSSAEMARRNAEWKHAQDEYQRNRSQLADLMRQMHNTRPIG